MYWRWVASSRPKSKTWTMLGCTSRATDSASRRKRATNWLVVGQVLGQQLDGHVALEALVEGAHDGRHAADAQALAQLVAAREDLAGHHGVVPRRPTCRPVPVSVPVVVRSLVPVVPVPVPVPVSVPVVPVSVVPVSVGAPVSVVGRLGGRRVGRGGVGAGSAASGSASGRRSRGPACARLLDARLQALAQAARRPSRAGSSSSFWALATRAAPPRSVAGAVVGRDLVQRALQARGVARRDPPVAAAGDEQRRWPAPSTSAASGGRSAHPH